MQRYSHYAIILSSLFSLSVSAQGVTYSQVQQAQQSIHNSIKGTLDGAVSIPRPTRNTARQLIFPQSLNNGLNNNPWSQSQSQSKSVIDPNGYNRVPKGNPWAPVGDTQNIPFDRSNMTGIERNPYTDAQQPRRVIASPRGFSNRAYSGYQTQNSPFSSAFNNNGFNTGGFSNGAYDGSNGSFSSPFGNGFSPTNQFWPNSNNGNASFPFMPW